MAQPTSSQVHVDAILTNISVAYMQKQTNFIASRVFPIVPVDKKSDVYYTYTKADWFRDEAQRRAAGMPSAGGGYGLSTASYMCEKWAFHKDIDDDTRANADAPINVDREATEYVTGRIALKQEVEFAAAYFGSSIWGTDITPTNLWSDFTASDPIGDIDTGKRAILAVTGFEPNKLVVGYDVWMKLKNHPDLIDRVKVSGAKVLTTELVAGLFELDEILVSKAVKATSLEGAATATFGFVAGKHALLAYAAPTPGLLAPSAGYIMSWKGVSGGLGKTIGTKRIRMEELASDRIEAESAFDMKVVGADLGYFFASVVA